MGSEMCIRDSLDISSINELPPGRKEILSYLFTGLKDDNNRVFDKCNEHLNNNSQIFVVCPYIDESENSDIQAAEIVYKEYKEKFKDKNVALLHGKMPYEEKERLITELEKMKKETNANAVIVNPKYWLVGDTGFEPVTPALSRQCSEPTELITRLLKLLKNYYDLTSKIFFK